MKSIFKVILILVINVIAYFLLQIIAAVVEFLLLGEGEKSGEYSTLISSFFVFIQICVILFLYYKKLFLNNNTVLVVNLVLVLGLYLYFVLYLPTTFKAF
jgi:hypothetical protein